MTGWPKRMFESFAFLAHWRDERKAVLQKTVFALSKLGHEIARRSKLSWSEVGLCVPYAIDRIPVPQTLINHYKDLVTNHYLAVYKGGKIEFLDQKTCEKLIGILEPKILHRQITGQIACKGKVSGTARVILGERDFSKFKPGDILVTVMTRPEFMPLIRQARAIVTDEGGITCHAAIVSRELNIPCVIGTRNATRIIKSGDKIQVDAIKGIITQN